MAAPRKDDPGFDVLRAAGAALAVVLLVGVVAVAAGAGAPSATRAGGSELTDPLATLLFVLGAVWVAAMLVASPLLTGMTMTGGEPRPRRWHGNVLAGAVFIAVVLAAFALLRRARGGRDGVTGQEAPTTSQRDEEGRRRVPGIDAADVDWLVVGLVFGVALVAFGILAAVIVRPRGRQMDELEARKALETMLEETLDDLRGERDPRRAVIAAYARMERSLGLYGLPRRPWEAPLEYLGRVLAQLTGSGSAARRLTRLFERAKFSEHSIDERMKDDAIEAVEAVRDDLRSLTVA